nr:ATP-binding protein [Faecalicoccus pleomorphus]
MQEVIETILKNCIDFADENSNIQITLNRLDKRIALEISDTGIPLNPLVDIFSRYETASRTKEHYGIGLHMAKQIIEQHFGTIHVESEDQQVKFLIHLPLHQLETFTY